MSESHFNLPGDESPAASSPGRGAFAEGERSLLDLSTQLDIFSGGVPERFGWQFTLWRECAEASLVWVPERSGQFTRHRPRLLDANGQPQDDPPPIPPNPWWLHPENDSFEGQSAGMLSHLDELERSEAAFKAQSWRIANGRAAQYGCKYSQKDWSPEHVGRGNHRYEVAQGFTPPFEKVWANGPSEAERFIAQLVPDADQQYLTSWDSQDQEDWGGPRARLWRW